jgi:hypothetical protein
MHQKELVIVGLGQREDDANRAYANPTALVSTDWVNDHLDDPSTTRRLGLSRPCNSARAVDHAT